MASEQFTLALFNLENTTSVTILDPLVAQMTSYEPDFVLFTNVSMEPHFTKVLFNHLKVRKYISDHFAPLGAEGHGKLKTREVLFRRNTLFIAAPVTSTCFDGSFYGFRTYKYSLDSKNETSVTIKTYTLPEKIEPHHRRSAIDTLTKGDLDLRCPEVVISDPRIMEWDDSPPPKEWSDLYDFFGSPKEEQNFDGSRRDRIWFRTGSARPVGLTSTTIDDPHNKLAGHKSITIGKLGWCT